MDLLWMINKIRYMKPIETFLDLLPFTLLAAPATFFFDSFVGLFKSDWDLIIILCLAIILDLIVGLVTTKARKGRITSLGARQTFIKFIEYFVFLGMLTIVGNGVEKYVNPESSWLVEQTATIFKDIDVFAYIMVIWVEVISIAENLADRKGIVKEIIKKINNMLKQKTEK